VPPGGDGKFLFTHHVFAARFNPGMEAWKLFVYFLLLQDTFRERAAGFATGTTVLALPRDAVLQLSFPKPNEQVVERFTSLVTPLVEKPWLLAAENRTLAALRDALLPKLISGELRIADAEKIVGRAF
jgi:type I restriction enzyme S subunit